MTVGTRAGSTFITIGMVHALMSALIECGVRDGATVVWRFSGVGVPIDQLRNLVKQWDVASGIPVLSLIAISLGSLRHVTVGVAAFAGFELSARFSSEAGARAAARNLARFARHAVANNGLDEYAVYQGVDGSDLTLDWSQAHEDPSVISIIL